MNAFWVFLISFPHNCAFSLQHPTGNSPTVNSPTVKPVRVKKKKGATILPSLCTIAKHQTWIISLERHSGKKNKSCKLVEWIFHCDLSESKKRFFVVVPLTLHLETVNCVSTVYVFVGAESRQFVEVSNKKEVKCCTRHESACRVQTETLCRHRNKN